MLNKVKLFLGGVVVSLIDSVLRDYLKDCIEIERNEEDGSFCPCCGGTIFFAYRSLRGEIIGYKCDNCNEPLKMSED